MAHRLSLLIVVQCLLSFLIQQCNGLVFRDVLPAAGNSLFRRDDYSSMDLVDQETFIWGGSHNSSAAMANFTVSMTGDNEEILSLEKFRNVLSSITCTNTSITLVFKDNGAFFHAQRQWNWVNNGNRTFVLVAGSGQCGWNTYRVPFVVTSVSYSNSTRTADLAAVPSSWAAIAHTCELWVGNLPSPPPSRFARRDFTETLTLNFEHTLPKSSWDFPLKIPNVTLSAECEDCGTHGEFEFAFHFQTVLFVPVGVDLTLKPNGVSASVTPALHMEADLADKVSSPVVQLGTIPIDGISIPGGVLDVGPELVIAAGASIGPLTAEATLSAGVEVDLSDSAQVTIGLTSPSFSESGWTPVIKTIPFTIDAEVKGEAEVFIQFSTELTLEALDHGFEMGLVLSPFASGEFIYKESSAGACDGDKEKRPFGIEIDPTIGITLSGDAEDTDDPNNPIFSTQLASVATALPTVCFPFGPAQT